MANVRSWSGARQLYVDGQMCLSKSQRDPLDQELEHLGRLWRDSTRNHPVQSKKCDDVVDVGGDFCGHSSVVTCIR